MIDLYAYKIPYDTIDGSHPTNVGMNTIATMIIREMIDQAGEMFLDCENEEHDYIMNEQYTGGIKYVCSKCSKVKHTDTLPSKEVTMDIKETTYKDDIYAKYFWQDRQVNKIKNILLAWGIMPVYYIEIRDDTIKFYRRNDACSIRGMGFPDGHFEEIKKPLDAYKKRKLFQFLETIDFSKWIKDDVTIAYFEKMSCGLLESDYFRCEFEDDTIFVCPFPPQNQFKKLIEYFMNYFSEENMEPFYPCITEKDEELGNCNETDNSEILRLTIKSSGQTVQFQNNVVEVGRDKTCDLLLESKVGISPHHATFIYEKDMWFLCDNFSTNGTWLNGVKMQPGKKYQLASNDVINFSGSKMIIFDQQEHNTQSTYDPDGKVIKLLEEAMIQFAKSDQKDVIALEFIVIALLKSPLYVTVETDMEEMLPSTKLKVKDILKSEKDVRLRTMKLPYNTIEFVGMFTSIDEANKGSSGSIIRLYFKDCLPKLVQMSKPVLINPFSENRKYLNEELITDVLVLYAQKMTNYITDIEEQYEDKYIGRTIEDKYEVVKLIGRGSYYNTYLVRNIHTNKEWAMKVCDKKSHQYSIALRDTILEESYMMNKLDHPAIVNAVDLIEDEDSIYMVIDYIEGETLEMIGRIVGSQPVDRVIEWSKQMCNVLAYFHSQNPPLIYRDMKPANVILQIDGTIKFIDFGTMRAYKQNQKSDTCCLGTKGYAAPEQFGGSQSDARTDIYGLGMTMFRLVTGVNPIKPPYEIKPICEIDPELPKGLEYIISKCIQQNPDERYQSCEELMADLNNYQNLVKPKGFFKKLFGKK